jgi:hypothetical protein
MFGDKLRKQRPVIQTSIQLEQVALMLIFPIATAVFAALIVATLLLWKAGANEPNS